MPVYNSERFLAEAIDSILQQTFTDFEFLIVDDGSTDCSAAIIQEYAQRDARISFIQLDENKGVATARNVGLAHASGELIAGMDSDDVSLPQRLAKQVAYLETHPGIGGVGVSHHVCDAALTPKLAHQLPAHHRSIILHLLLYTKSTIKTANVMLRREYLDIEPLYDPSYIYCIDLELFLRLVWVKRIRFANLPEQLYLYRRHAHTTAIRHQADMKKYIINARRPSLRQLGERGAGVEWIVNRSPPVQLNWRERGRARRDITRLIEAMVEHNWVDAGDEQLLLAEMNQLVESTSPRCWQMFLHWYRYRIARHLRL